MIAIRHIRKERKGRKTVEKPYGDPIKFLDLQSEASTFVQSWNSGSMLSRITAENWSIGQFAEWVREQLENINNRLDNHNL
jgi:hypothetical protein